MSKFIKLSEWAKNHGYTYRGAFGLFQSGKLKNAKKIESGAIVVKCEENVSDNKDYVIVYARVSSSENKNNLISQAERVSQFCNAKGWIVNEVVKECASGLNDKRPKLLKILKDKKATKLVVEHKDRLTRFGFNYIKCLYSNCEIVVINESSDDREDLMGDFISIVTSYCARIYGNRRSKRKTEKLIKELSND